MHGFSVGVIPKYVILMAEMVGLHPGNPMDSQKTMFSQYLPWRQPHVDWIIFIPTLLLAATHPHFYL